MINLSFFSFLFNFLVLYAFSPFGPCATPPPTNIGAFLLACLALPVPFCAYIFDVEPIISFFCFVLAFLPLLFAMFLYKISLINLLLNLVVNILSDTSRLFFFHQLILYLFS